MQVTDPRSVVELANDLESLLYNWTDSAMRARVVHDAAMRRGVDTTNWAMSKMETLRSYEDHYRDMEQRIPALAS